MCGSVDKTPSSSLWSFIYLIAASILVFNSAIEDWAGTISLTAVADLREILADQNVYFKGIQLHLSPLSVRQGRNYAFRKLV